MEICNSFYFLAFDTINFYMFIVEAVRHFICKMKYKQFAGWMLWQSVHLKAPKYLLYI